MGSTSTNSNQKKIKQVEYRLKEWGRWVVVCITSGLGWPSQSSSEGIFQGSRSTGPVYPKDNYYAEEVHKIILAMNKHHPDWVTVVRAEYTDSGNQVHKADNMNLSRASYRKTLDLAKAWIESALS